MIREARHVITSLFVLKNSHWCRYWDFTRNITWSHRQPSDETRDIINYVLYHIVQTSCDTTSKTTGGYVVAVFIHTWWNHNSTWYVLIVDRCVDQWDFCGTLSGPRTLVVVEVADILIHYHWWSSHDPLWMKKIYLLKIRLIKQLPILSYSWAAWFQRFWPDYGCVAMSVCNYSQDSLVKFITCYDVTLCKSYNLLVYLDIAVDGSVSVL